MLITVLKAKIHGATVTGSEINYQGSIGVDSALLEEVGILPFEQVHVYNITNGERFVTYAIEEKRQSGTICINGAAARLVQVGDRVIIVAYGSLDEPAARSHRPRVLILGNDNQVPKA